MSRTCHETGRDVKNPYHVIKAVLKDPNSGRIAYSNLELSLGNEAYNKIKKDLQKEPTGEFCYAIETHTGTTGGFFGAVQVSLPSTPHRDYKYLDEIVACVKLPKSTATLNENPEWVEQSWQKATWAGVAYTQLKKTQLKNQ